jgi:hypothetical protein
MRKGLSLRLEAHGHEVLFSADAFSATAVLAKENPIWSFLMRGSLAEMGS